MNSVLKNNSFVLLLLLSLVSCKDKDLVTSILPSEPIVRLLSPQNNQVISDSVTIQIETYDDKGIRHLSVFIDDNYQFADNKNDTIHNFFWNTRYLVEGSHHKIKALGDDGEGHVTASKEIDVVVYRFTPSNLTAHLLTDSTIELTWQDNSKYETGFEIEQTGSDSVFTKIASLDSNETKYIVKGNFSPEQKYQFRVRAFVNTNPSWYSNTASAELFLIAPTNLTVNFENDTTAVLTWADNNFFEDGFDVEMATNSFPFEKIATVDKNTTTVKINRVFLVTQNYKFQLRAKYKSFNSGYTNAVSLQFQFPAPTDLTIQQVTETSVKLEWKDNSNFEEEFVIRRMIEDVGSTELGRVSKNVTSFTVTDLDIKQNYAYMVFARTRYNATFLAELNSAFTPTFELSKTINPGFGAIQNLKVSPDGRIIATEGFNGNSLLVKLYSTSDGSFLRSTSPIDSIPSFIFGMNKIEFSKDGKVITAVTDAPYLYLWNVSDGSLIRKISTSTTYSTLEFSPDTKTFVGVRENTLYFWNYVNGTFEKSIWKESPFTNLTFNSSGSYFVTGSDCCAALWDANTRTIFKYFSSSTPTRYVHFTKNDEKIISVNNGLISIWNVASGSLEKQFKIAAYYSDVTVSADEKYIFACNGSSILTYRIDTGAHLTESPIEKEISSLFITSDGLTAIGKTFNRISIYNVINKWQKLH